MHSNMQSTNKMYLDYTNQNNCEMDEGGKLFANHNSVDHNKKQINLNIYNNVMDYTQKYQPCSKPTVPSSNQMMLKKIINQSIKKHIDKHDPKLTLPNQNNNSSSIYADMKNYQKKMDIIEQSTSSLSNIQNIKNQQALELMKKLEMSNKNDSVNNSQFLNMNNFASVDSKIHQTTCLDAQGQWLQHNTKLYNDDKWNKYQIFKKMSPEQLNKIYNKPGNQSILPEINDANDDVFDLTSQEYKNKLKQNNQGLQSEINKSYQSILSQKCVLKSFNQIDNTAIF